MKKSVGFSISVLFLFVAMVGSFLCHSKEDNYLLAEIFFAPFAITLIVGTVRCLFREHHLKNESVSYILFRYSFQKDFEFWCLMAVCFLCYTLLDFTLGGKFNTLIYVTVCGCVAIGSDFFNHDSNVPDDVESERISYIKVFLLSLALTPIAGYIVACMYKAKQSKKTETMKLHLERAKAYLEDKDYTNAIVECKEGLNGMDDFDKLRKSLALSLDVGIFAQREVSYDILHVLAEIYCEQKKYSEAVEAYHKAMYIFPHDESKARQCVDRIVYSEWVDKNRAVASQALDVLKNYEERYPYGESFTEKRIHLMDNEAITYNENASYAEQAAEQAEAHLKQKDYESAIDDYTKAIAYAPEDDSYLNKSYYYKKRAKVYFEQKDYANAVDDYTKAMELASESDKFYLYRIRAEVYRKQEDYTSAIADYTKLIELAPEDDKSFFYDIRAKAYLEIDNKEQAEADFAKAKELEEKQENE